MVHSRKKLISKGGRGRRKERREEGEEKVGLVGGGVMAKVSSPFPAPSSQIGSESFFFSSAFLWGREGRGLVLRVWAQWEEGKGGARGGGYIWDTEGWHPFLPSGGGGQF